MTRTQVGDRRPSGRSRVQASSPRSRRRRAAMLSALALAVILVLVPVVVTGDYNLGRVRLGLVYILAALALNLAFGWAGEFTLGHVAIMATAAYMSSILVVEAHWPVIAAMLGGIAAGVVVAIVMALPSVRVRGAYLGLLTLFAVLAIPPIVTLAAGVTGGSYGLAGIPLIPIGGIRSAVVTYEMAAVFVIAVLWVTWNLGRSSWGIRLSLLRHAPHAARAVGLGLAPIKLAVYTLYAIPASIAGEIIAYGDSFVTARSFNLELTLLILTGVILGGRGTLWGPVVGTIPLVILTFYIGPFSSVNPVIFGAVLVLVVLLFPNGVVPAVREGGWRRIVRRGGGPAATLTPGDGAPAVAGEPETAVVDPNQRSEPEHLEPQPRDTPGGWPTGEPILAVDGAVKQFGGVRALDSLSLRILAGGVTGIVGQNGSGKSTLLNVVNGFYSLDSGSVSILGQNTTKWSVHQIARLGVSRTFQIPRLAAERTVAQNIEAGLLHEQPAMLLSSILGLPRVSRAGRDRRDRVRDMMAMLNLPPDLADVRVSRLPLGLKRIVEVGRAAVNLPPVLLLDEPAAGLDDSERAVLTRSIVSISALGVTPVVVEHNIDFVMSACQTVVLMDHGRAIASGDTADPGAFPAELSNYLRYSHVL